MIDAYIYGMLNCTRAAIPLMKGRPGAMMSSVSSTGGRYGVGLLRDQVCRHRIPCLRKELGLEGIRVSVILSGAVWTEFGHNVPEEALRERPASLDALTADDVAQALVYTFAQHPRVLVEDILLRPVKQVAP
jgi:NADP-dependent 3-hydroxy acid dehydrogenase YdfG